jgi:hypothetical protein
MATPLISRDRSPVAVLLAPGVDIPLGENNIRLHDYLNDKFQTSLDLKNIDGILASVEKQKEQLDKQVCCHIVVIGIMNNR